MINRRKFLISLALLPALMSLNACRDSEPLNVGVHPWIGYESLYLSRDFGWFPKNIQFKDHLNASQSLEGLRRGDLDVACLTLDEMLRARSEGIPLTAILVFDVSAGADVVLAKPEIKTIQLLKGKRIAVENTAVAALMLNKILKISGLTSDELTIIDSPIDSQITLWKNNQIDAAISYNPMANLLARESGNRIFDSRKIPNTILDVLAVRQDISRDKQKAIKALVKGHFMGLSHIQIHRQDAIYRIAKHQQLSADEIKDALSGVILPTLEANRHYLNSENGRLTTIADNVSAVLVEAGLLNKNDSLEKLSDNSYLPIKL